MLRKRETVDGYSGPVPWVVSDAANVLRRERERAASMKAAYLTSWTGVPLSVACLAFLAAVPFLFLAPWVSLTFFVLSVALFLCTLALLVSAWRVDVRDRRDHDLFRSFCFAYGLEALGGPGSLPPIDCLSVADLGSRSVREWQAEHLSDPVLRESFVSLSQEWSGDSRSLVEACKAL